VVVCGVAAGGDGAADGEDDARPLTFTVKSGHLWRVLEVIPVVRVVAVHGGDKLLQRDERLIRPKRGVRLIEDAHRAMQVAHARFEAVTAVTEVPVDDVRLCCREPVHMGAAPPAAVERRMCCHLAKPPLRLLRRIDRHE
jgi:hypothetical protein